MSIENVSKRLRLLERLRSAGGGIVSDEELLQYSRLLSRGAMDQQILMLRENHNIVRVRRRGYYLVVEGLAPGDVPLRTDDEFDDPQDHIPDSRQWRPEHEGDPLLEALRRAHPELA